MGTSSPDSGITSPDDSYGSPQGDSDTLPVYFLTSGQIEYLTDYSDEPEGYYAVWYYDSETIDLEPVLETASGEWTFTGNSYDYLEIDTEYFPSIEAILAYLDNPTPTGYAYPSEVAGESFPIYFLSSAQLLDLTELSDQPSGNYALWDGGGWIDLEPVLMDGAGTWTLTEDEEDYLEVDSAQFSSFQSVIDYLLDPTPQGHLLLDPTPTSPDIGDASPDAGYSSPDSGTISPDDSYYSEGDGFADGDYPDIPYPDDPYHSGGDGFLG